MVSNDFCPRFSIYRFGCGFSNANAEKEKMACERRRRRVRRGVVGFNRNENAEPIGARSHVRRKIDNVVRRIPNPLHRFFNPICRSFAGRIPMESVACEPFAAIRPTSARQRIDKLRREGERGRERKRKKKDPGIGCPSGAQSTWKTVPPLKDNPLT